MPRRRGPAKPDLIRQGKELGNEIRNERQKNVLLREVGRLARGELDAVIQKSKQIVEESKKLCQKSKTPTHRRRAS